MLKFIIARHDQKIYENYIEKSLKNIDCESYDVFDEENENLTLTQKYNLGIGSIKNLDDNDIVVFIHEDVEIMDNLFKEKIDLIFKNENVGLLGVIGCTEFTKNGMWWANRPENLFGHIIQENNDKENHLVKGAIGYSDNIVAVDGLILMIRGKLLKDGLRFDSRFGMDFYDISICLDILMKTDYKIAIADILVKHRSVGMGSLGENWKNSRDAMLKKYKDIIFPIDRDRIDQYKGKNLYERK